MVTVENSVDLSGTVEPEQQAEQLKTALAVPAHVPFDVPQMLTPKTPENTGFFVSMEHWNIIYLFIIKNKIIEELESI